MDFSKIKHIYMIGIKGVGMTMLAQFLVARGHSVSGSDTEEKFMTDRVLASDGIVVKEGFDEKNISAEADLVIYSSAYNKDTNVEVEKSLQIGKKTLTYAEVLGDIFNQMYGIAVCGSHGKTTVSAWLGYVLKMAGKEPNVLVGSRVEQFKGNTITGDSDYFVIEADEYQNKLQYYSPKMVLLNNIDHDHHDFFPSKESYLKVFSDFVAKISKNGFLIANFDDDNVVKIATSKCGGKVLSYGIENDAFLMASNLTSEFGRQSFEVTMDKTSLGSFSITLLGKHNVYNALAVIAASIEMEVGLVDIRKYLELFSGTDRRMSVLGKFRGATIIDDYAHHPTEIKTTLAGLREVNKDKKITVVFHPHTFSRTKALFNDFATSFSDADQVIVLDIYGSARETLGGVHSRDLADAILGIDKSKKVLYIATKDEVEKYLRDNIEKDEIVLLMGAGDVFRIGEALVN